MAEIFTVSSLTAKIKNCLESGFSFIRVRGEISNLKEQSSGHIYFTLKDETAQISAVLFKGNARLLERAPKAGEEIIATGELSVYAPRGNYQMIVRTVEYSGIGDLLLKLHKLKLKLQELGWFDQVHKKSLPKLPKTIGVITSPTGSVIRDILHILQRRFPNFRLILNPVRVQGELAKEDIVQAIKQFNEYNLADVLIVGRGGGSLEDLFAFNEEIVAKAIFESKIPIISAVGHETDTSISDLVADVRAPTPSAAAELVIAEKREFVDFLSLTKRRTTQNLLSLLEKYRKILNALRRQPIFARPDTLLAGFRQQVDEIKYKFSHQNLFLQKKFCLESSKKRLSSLNLNNKIGTMRQNLKEISKQLKSQTLRLLDRHRERLQSLKSLLNQVHPKNILKKGYCIPFQEKSDSVILSVRGLNKKDRINLILHDGSAISTIEELTYEQ